MGGRSWSRSQVTVTGHGHSELAQVGPQDSDGGGAQEKTPPSPAHPPGSRVRAKGRRPSGGSPRRQCKVTRGHPRPRPPAALTLESPPSPPPPRTPAPLPDMIKTSVELRGALHRPPTTLRGEAKGQGASEPAPRSSSQARAHTHPHRLLPPSRPGHRALQDGQQRCSDLLPGLRGPGPGRSCCRTSRSENWQKAISS